MHFSPSRLMLARQRRGWTLTELARRADLTKRSLTEYEGARREPTDANLERLALALGFPVAFFRQVDVDLFPTPRRGETPYTSSPASFRSHYRIPARARDQVLAAGVLATLIADELDKRFHLPACAVPDLRDDDHFHLSPAAAATALREMWGLGDRPAPNLVHLLESKGVRVFRLSEDLQEVDALSFWRGTTPYVILNSVKSGERSRFDAAHELGHLVLHSHGDTCGKDAEEEANAFAAAFLLPEAEFRRRAPAVPLFDQLLKLKPHFRVSLAAMVRRGHELGLYSDWQARQCWMEIGRRGWRKGEPGALEHEQSLVFEKVRVALSGKGTDLLELARAQHLPIQDFVALVPLSAPRTGVEAPAAALPADGPPSTAAPTGRGRALAGATHLRLIDGGRHGSDAEALPDPAGRVRLA